ncbi:2OG-Fe(II) oxygenase family protein [uncultured Roseobacter sp.]|uniref:2OG-Fe(II) oxygenase family protein n=1 Tax=uncultured Roseobacter sp. TaxID=114847 RepID=UPI00260DF525|nr:2OG-Fe(II) oxygenase family protein [uncultured Roseobacter sp.]
MALLALDGFEGSQARMRTGDWVTVPPKEGALAVNFGKLLQRWTGGANQTPIHRVIGVGTERFSIPFFREPSVNAVISHIPGCGAPFEQDIYGDHLWEATVGFVEQRGIAHLRHPKGIGAAS